MVDPSFQGIHRHFVLSFEDVALRSRHTGYFLPQIKLKDYNVMIDGRKFLINIKDDTKTYKSIRKIDID